MKELKFQVVAIWYGLKPKFLKDQISIPHLYFLTSKTKPDKKQICEPLTCKPKPNKHAIISFEPNNHATTSSQSGPAKLNLKKAPPPHGLWYGVLTKRERERDKVRENHLDGEASSLKAWFELNLEKKLERRRNCRVNFFFLDFFWGTRGSSFTGTLKELESLRLEILLN